MKRRNRIALVIDADIACACPTTVRPESNPRAVSAKNALEAIRVCDRLTASFDDRLLDEWNRRRSEFAKKWLGAMIARKRFRKLECPPLPQLRDQLARLDSELKRTAAEKDAHLIELALVADRRVLSFDRRARSTFATVARRMTELREFYWASPTDDGCLVWLRDGTPEDERFRLDCA